MNRRKIKLKRRTQPHSIPPLPRYGHFFLLKSVGELKKSYLVAIISIILLLSLTLFLFFSGTFTGKAYSVAGGHQIDLVVNPNGNLELTANIQSPTRINSFYFELKGDNLCQQLGNILTQSITNNLWNEFYTLSCDNDILTFADATLNPQLSKTGLINVVELSGLTIPDNTEFEILTIDAYNSITGEDLFPGGDTFTLSGVSDVPPVVSSGSSGGSSGGGSGGNRRTLYQCNDRKDNDGDGFIDYPNDPDCKSNTDNNETRGPCTESWTCSAWSTCQNNEQKRLCTDEHSCGTIINKPVLQKSCASVASGPYPTRTTTQNYIPPLIQEPGFWDKYLAHIIGSISALIILVALALVILHFVKHERVAYNIEELEDWIEKERAMGTSNEDIKNILIDQTKWSEDEITDAFESLRTPGTSAGFNKKAVAK